jgi:hypothetical protein
MHKSAYFCLFLFGIAVITCVDQLARNLYLALLTLAEWFVWSESIPLTGGNTGNTNGI